jgi:hypothetical protein
MDKEEEIGQLLDALEGKVEEESDGEVQGEEKGSEEVVEEKAEEVEEEEEEEVVEEEKTEEVEEEKKEESVVDEKDKTISELRAQIEALSKPKEEPVEKHEPSEVDVTIPEQDFVGDIDVDDVVRDPKSLNSLLNKVYTKAAKDIFKMVSESNAKSLPNIVRENIELVNNLKATHDKFYAENPQLAGFKKAVAATFKDVQEGNKGKSYEEILSLTASEAYKRLGLKKDSKPQLKSVPKLPSKQGGGTKPSSKSAPKGVETEIDEMLKTAGD